MKLSIVVPCHNEADNIVRLIERIEAAVTLSHELVIVNDHSNDRTVELVNQLARQNKNISLVENRLNKGFANALKSGFANCKTDIIIPVMGDLCDDLSTIEQMYNKINDGYDVVCGSRYCGSGSRLGGSRFKAFLSYWAGKSLYWLLGIPTHDIANAFKMYRKKVIESMALESTGFEISMEIPLKAYYLGFKITEVPTVWKERTQGKSSFKIFKLLPRYLKLYLRALRMRLKK